ncbi:MAG: hypothetical protein U0795_03125 [Pirellulales bacterium]
MTLPGERGEESDERADDQQHGPVTRPAANERGRFTTGGGRSDAGWLGLLSIRRELDIRRVLNGLSVLC